MTRYLLMPLRSAPLILVATFTLLWWFTFNAGFLGFPLAILLVSWFFKYCYALLDAVVAGHNDLPVLSVEMLNPVDEQRPLFQAVMIIFESLACWWVYRTLGPAAGLVLGAVLLSTLPATVGLLAISDSWVHALSPAGDRTHHEGPRPQIYRCGGGHAGWHGTDRNSGSHPGFTAAGAGARPADIHGHVLFCRRRHLRNRIDLQLATRTYDERVAERDERRHADERAAVLDRTYALLRLKRRREAWAHLEAWMRQHCPDAHPFTEYHALQQATCSWDDPDIGDRVTTEHLGKLLANGETGMALEALQLRLASNPGFYPYGQAYAVRLNELATLSGRKAMSRQLLANAAAQRDGAAPKS